MTTQLQLDSFQYKCKCCLKYHLGRTRVLEFKCVDQQIGEHGVERLWEADYVSTCDCDQTMKITFRIREHPESIFSYKGYSSGDADLIIEPKVREHTDIVD